MSTRRKRIFEKEKTTETNPQSCQLEERVKKIAHEL